MKTRLSLMILAMLLASCVPSAMQGPFRVDKPFAGPAPYGEGLHPGIDYGISTGTPVIAATRGKVIFIQNNGPDGWDVVVKHGNHFNTVYAHLSKVVVEDETMVKRGQIIGLSGESNNYSRRGYSHLHFGLCKQGRGLDCHNYSQSIDPRPYWLGGEPQCFDPGRDYSAATQNDITLPLACGEYAKHF